MGNLSLTDVRDQIAELNEEAIILDGFDSAIIGMVERCGLAPVVCYDRARCLEIIQETNGGNRQAAEEHFDFNVSGGYLGEYTPVFLTRLGIYD